MSDIINNILLILKNNQTEFFVYSEFINNAKNNPNNKNDQYSISLDKLNQNSFIKFDYKNIRLILVSLSIKCIKNENFVSSLIGGWSIENDDDDKIIIKYSLTPLIENAIRE